MIAGNLKGHRLKAFLKIRPDRGNKYQEEILVGGFYPYACTGSDQQRPQIQRSTGSVGRNKALIEPDGRSDGL